MSQFALFWVLFAAIVIGWLLGRFSVQKSSSRERSSSYYQGLNYLFDGKPDGATDAFIDSLEVNAETFETHLLLGNLLRKRGEVQRAIRVHANILEHRALQDEQKHEAHLELARDYISAGLLDRAEQLLLDLISESALKGVEARRYLIEIYQAERDWDKAIAMAGSLLSKRGLFQGRKNEIKGPGEQSVHVLLPHFYCELAEKHKASGDINSAKQALGAAFREDPNNVRVTLMRAQLEAVEGEYEKALGLLLQVENQDKEFLPEVASLFKQCAEALGQLDRYERFLRDSMQKYPSTGLVIALTDLIKDREGAEAATLFLTDAMRNAASLRGLYRLMILQLEESRSQLSSKLEVAMELMRQLTETSPGYRCQHCGFRGKHLHWFCPGCKFWGSIKPIGLIKKLNS